MDLIVLIGGDQSDNSKIRLFWDPRINYIYLSIKINVMKIEFIKETGLDGRPCYYTRVNDSLVSDSLKFIEEDAQRIYEKIVKLNGNTTVKEVLKSTEI